MNFTSVTPIPTDLKGNCPSNTKYMPCTGMLGKAFICDPDNGYITKEEVCQSSYSGTDFRICPPKANYISCPDSKGEEQDSLRSKAKSFFDKTNVKIAGVTFFLICVVILICIRYYRNTA